MSTSRENIFFRFQWMMSALALGLIWGRDRDVSSSTRVSRGGGWRRGPGFELVPGRVWAHLCDNVSVGALAGYHKPNLSFFLHLLSLYIPLFIVMSSVCF